MILDDGADWITGFDSWEELRELLMNDWIQVEDLQLRVQLRRREWTLLMLETDGRQLSAKHRRGLQHLGFRESSTGRLTAWRWCARTALEDVDLTAFASPMDSILETWHDGVSPAAIQQMRIRRALRQLLTQQTQQVLRQGFRSEPNNLAVMLRSDSDPGDYE